VKLGATGFRIRRVFVVSVIAGVVAGAAFAGSARAVAVGLEPDLNWGISKAEQDRTGTLMNDLGPKWVRLTMQWK
jgi:hypothetical protein